MNVDSAARILDAACDLIAEEGIDEVRIARVAQRAGASTSLVHHYFSTREELLEQALIYSFERTGDERFGGEGESASGTGTATQSMRLAIRDSLPAPGAQEREWVLWVELWLRAVREPDLRPVATRLYERYRTWIAAVIRSGLESGEFDAGLDVEATADLAITLLDGAGIRALLDDPGMTVADARVLVARTLAPVLGVEADSLL